MVWRLRCIVEAFASIELAGDDAYRQLPVFDGRPLADGWHPLQGRLGSGAVGEFAYLTAGTVACRDAILPEIEAFAGDEIERLSLDISDEPHSLLNVTGASPVLDLERSVVERFPESQRVYRVHKYVLNPDRLLQKWLFKIPEVARTQVFATDAFRSAYETHRWTGLEFIPVEVTS